MFGGIAPGFFQRIGQDGQAVEGAVGVDAGGEGDGGFRSPAGVECDRAERVAENAAEEVAADDVREKLLRPGGVVRPNGLTADNHSRCA